MATSDASQPPRFPTTRWTRVAAAGAPHSPEAREALAELCSSYWYPLYAFIRRKGHKHEAALDLTQDYFARLLERGTITAADPVKGRFRSFLLADCSYFLADRRDHDNARKRGGGRTFVPIDPDTAETRFRVGIEPAHDQTAERLFERDWVLALLDRVFDRLERRYDASGRQELFAHLKPILSSDPDAARYAALAVKLGMTEGNLRVTVHRLRAGFAAELRGEIAATLDDPSPAEIDDELRALFEALGR